MHSQVENNREAIARLCRLHGVRSLEAFGSMLREDFDSERSDVDVLVEFEAQAAASFSNFEKGNDPNPTYPNGTERNG
jgi:predicted nucleotidyltransferase